MHLDFLGKLRQLMTLLLGDRRLQGLGYPGIPEDQVIVEIDEIVFVMVGYPGIPDDQVIVQMVSMVLVIVGQIDLLPVMALMMVIGEDGCDES